MCSQGRISNLHRMVNPRKINHMKQAEIDSIAQEIGREIDPNLLLFLWISFFSDCIVDLHIQQKGFYAFFVNHKS